MIEQLDATMQNALRLNEIEKQCFGRDAWTVPNLVGEFNNRFSFLYGKIIDDEIVGYACVRIMYEEAQICNVAVMPDFRRRGIGVELINALAECALEEGCKYCELEVNTENEAAIALYKRCGFEIAGTRKNFYRKTKYNSRDAYTMVKYLSQGQTEE